MSCELSKCLQALLDPLATINSWASLEIVKTELSSLANTAIGTHNHSLWWNYIYLHERYVATFSPVQKDRLPGFPDMDTAIKVGAPPVYNWYYMHHGQTTEPWNTVSFADLCASKSSGFLANIDARSLLRDELHNWTTGDAPDVQRLTAPPFWLIASAWSQSPEWGALLTALHAPFLQGKFAGISLLDRKVACPVALWQWHCVAKKDISFLPQTTAIRALDALRQSSLNDQMRSVCESHFLNYFPQCKPDADIAFALGAPLCTEPIHLLERFSLKDALDSSTETLRPQ